MANLESKEAIARRLEVTRLALGYETQVSFARAVGVTYQRWNNYESGRDRLTLNLALTIRQKFPQITLDWLFCNDRGTLRPTFLADIDAADRIVKNAAHVVEEA